MRSLRCFTAIAMPDAIASQIARLQDACPIGREVPEENLHLTLTFHGDQPLSLLEEFDSELQSLQADAFDVTLHGVDVFGGKERGGLWLLAEPSPQLLALQAAVSRSARRAGIESERRKFRPHVTFVRFSRPPDSVRLQSFLDNFGRYGPLTFRATEVTLFQSTLTKSGAIYDALSDYALKNI